MADDVTFEIMLPTFGEMANPETFRRLATQAERDGFNAVWYLGAT